MVLAFFQSNFGLRVLGFRVGGFRISAAGVLEPWGPQTRNPKPVQPLLHPKKPLTSVGSLLREPLRAPLKEPLTDSKA